MAPETKKRYAAERVADTCNRIEGVPVSKHAQELSRQWVHGQISGDEAGVFILPASLSASGQTHHCGL